jgi:hypothetical protein
MKRTSPSRIKLVAKFTAPDGTPWRIYHADRRACRALFDIGERYLAVGISVFAGRHKNKIFIDSRQPARVIFDTTVHELMHVACHDMGLDRMVEEAFIEGTATRLAFMLEQLP